MKTPLETRLLATSTRVKSLADNAFKHPISSILSLCLIAGIAATIATFSQTTQAPVQPTASLPVARTITDTKGRSLEGTIIAKSNDSITFERNGKKFEIKLETLSPEDNAFVATIAGQTKKPSVLLVIDESDTYTYLETLPVLVSRGFDVTVGFCPNRNNPKDDKFEYISKFQKTVLLSSVEVIDAYDILWFERFNRRHADNYEPNHFTLANRHGEKNKKITVIECFYSAIKPRYYITKEANPPNLNLEKLRYFVKPTKNWVFYRNPDRRVKEDKQKLDEIDHLLFGEIKRLLPYNK